MTGTQGKEEDLYWGAMENASWQQKDMAYGYHQCQPEGQYMQEIGEVYEGKGIQGKKYYSSNFGAGSYHKKD